MSELKIPPGLKVPPLTRLTKKRLYIPTVDVSENPFCQDRQLTDAVAKIQCKPQMVVDVEVALAKKELKSDLPTSVFAPAKEVMQRNRNSLFGTAEGAQYMLKTATEKAVAERIAKGEDPNGEDDGPGVYVPDPNDLFAPPDKSYFPDPFEVAAGLSTKVPPLKDVSHPTSFGHRPKSASRHFDPLTMNATRFRGSSKNLPCAGLLSASDLHKMLKHGQDAVGMGPSPAERGEAPLPGSVDYVETTNLETQIEGQLQDQQEEQMQLENALSSQSATRVDPDVEGGQPSDRAAVTNSTLDPSTQASSVMFSTSSSDGSGIALNAEVTQRTTGQTILERTAPLGLVRAPDWMGGVFSIGMGKSLFNKTEIEKIAIRKKKKLRKLRKKHRAGRPKWHGKVYRPPPERAFRSALAEDDAALMTSKEKIQKYARLSGGVLSMPTCEARQEQDMRERNDVQSKLVRQSKVAKARREYTRNSSALHSSTPRIKHKHDIEEIIMEVERRMQVEALRQEEEGGGEEEEEDAVVGVGEGMIEGDGGVHGVGDFEEDGSAGNLSTI